MSSYADPWQYAQGLIDPVSGLPKKNKKKNDPYSRKPTMTGQQAYQQSMNIAQGFSPNLAEAMFGGLGSASGAPAVPNYKDIINQYAKPELDLLKAQGISDASSLDSATQRALTLFGQIPSFDGVPGVDLNAINRAITPEVRQMAQANTEAGLSIAARQQKAFQDQVRAIKNALAARGALRSGEAGHQLQEAQLGRDQASFDSTRELVEFIAGLQAGLAERERQRQLQGAQAQAAASQAAARDYPGLQPGAAEPAPQSQDQQSQPGARQGAGRSDLPPGWIGAPQPGLINGPGGINLAEILRTVAPPKPNEIRLPGGGGTLNYFGLG